MYAKARNEREAVRLVQTLTNVFLGSNVLRTDGIVGPATLKAVASLPAAGARFVRDYARAQGVTLPIGSPPSAFDKVVLISEPSRNVESKGFGSTQNVVPAARQKVAQAPPSSVDPLIVSYKNMSREQLVSHLTKRASTSIPKGTDESRMKYIREFAIPALEYFNRFGDKRILAQGTLAQIAIETNWGEGFGLIPMNFGGMKSNLFGKWDEKNKRYSAHYYEKADSIGYVTRMTNELLGGRMRKIPQDFATFRDFEEWYQAYCWYLLRSSRYLKGYPQTNPKHSAYGRKVKVSLEDTKNPKQFAETLWVGGYATGNYNTKLPDVVTSHRIRFRKIKGGNSYFA